MHVDNSSRPSATAGRLVRVPASPQRPTPSRPSHHPLQQQDEDILSTIDYDTPDDEEDILQSRPHQLSTLSGSFNTTRTTLHNSSKSRHQTEDNIRVHTKTTDNHEDTTPHIEITPIAFNNMLKIWSQTSEREIATYGKLYHKSILPLQIANQVKSLQPTESKYNDADAADLSFKRTSSNDIPYSRKSTVLEERQRFVFVPGGPKKALPPPKKSVVQSCQTPKPFKAESSPSHKKYQKSKVEVKDTSPNFDEIKKIDVDKEPKVEAKIPLSTKQDQEEFIFENELMLKLSATGLDWNIADVYNEEKGESIFCFPLAKMAKMKKEFPGIFTRLTQEEVEILSGNIYSFRLTLTRMPRFVGSKIEFLDSAGDVVDSVDIENFRGIEDVNGFPVNSFLMDIHPGRFVYIQVCCEQHKVSSSHLLTEICKFRNTKSNGRRFSVASAGVQKVGTIRGPMSNFSFYSSASALLGQLDSDCVLPDLNSLVKTPTELLIIHKSSIEVRKRRKTTGMYGNFKKYEAIVCNGRIICLDAEHPYRFNIIIPFCGDSTVSAEMSSNVLRIRSCFHIEFEIKCKSSITRNRLLSAIEIDSSLRKVPSPLLGSLKFNSVPDEEKIVEDVELPFVPSTFNLNLQEEDDDFDNEKQLLGVGKRKGSIDQEKEAENAKQSRLFCKQLRNQTNFFAFFHDTLLPVAANFVSSRFPGLRKWQSKSGTYLRQRGKTLKELDITIFDYELHCKSVTEFVDGSYLFLKDARRVTTQQQIRFSFPGLETQIFDVKQYGVIEVRKCFVTPGESSKESEQSDDSFLSTYSESQWQNALSSHSVAKELMQCTADIEGLYNTGEIERAKRLAWISNCDLLRILSIASFCASNATKISEESLTSFTSNDVLESLSDKANAKVISESFGSKTFLINPRINHLYSLLSSDRMSEFSFLCTPLHWLFLLRFILIEKIGKLKVIASAIAVWKGKHIGRTLNRWDQVISLEEVCNDERKFTERVLCLLPSIKDMASALQKEKDRIHVLSPSPNRKRRN